MKKASLRTNKVLYKTNIRSMISNGQGCYGGGFCGFFLRRKEGFSCSILYTSSTPVPLFYLAADEHVGCAITTNHESLPQ